jgi:hypothetical protein
MAEMKSISKGNSCKAREMYEENIPEKNTGKVLLR